MSSNKTDKSSLALRTSQYQSNLSFLPSLTSTQMMVNVPGKVSKQEITFDRTTNLFEDSYHTP